MWQAATEKLIQYARHDEEKEKLIARHREVLNKLLDADGELNDLLMDSDTEVGAPAPTTSPPAVVTSASTNVDLEKDVE